MADQKWELNYHLWDEEVAPTEPITHFIFFVHEGGARCMSEMEREEREKAAMTYDTHHIGRTGWISGSVERVGRDQTRRGTVLGGYGTLCISRGASTTHRAHRLPESGTQNCRCTTPPPTPSHAACVRACVSRFPSCMGAAWREGVELHCTHWVVRQAVSLWRGPDQSTPPPPAHRRRLRSGHLAVHPRFLLHSHMPARRQLPPPPAPPPTAARCRHRAHTAGQRESGGGVSGVSPAVVQRAVADAHPLPPPPPGGLPPTASVSPSGPPAPAAASPPPGTLPEAAACPLPCRPARATASRASSASAPATASPTRGAAAVPAALPHHGAPAPVAAPPPPRTAAVADPCHRETLAPLSCGA